jgi:hypothetical protein
MSENFPTKRYYPGTFSAFRAKSRTRFRFLRHIYSLLGVLVAAAGALENSFKLGTRASGLARLAAECDAKLWCFDELWRTSVGDTRGLTDIPQEKKQAAARLLDLQDKALDSIQGKAAEFDVNIAKMAREQHRIPPPEWVRRMASGAAPDGHGGSEKPASS